MDRGLGYQSNSLTNLMMTDFFGKRRRNENSLIKNINKNLAIDLYENLTELNRLVS